MRTPARAAAEPWSLDFDVAQPDVVASSKYLRRLHRAAVD